MHGILFLLFLSKLKVFCFFNEFLGPDCKGGEEGGTKADR